MLDRYVAIKNMNVSEHLHSSVRNVLMLATKNVTWIGIYVPNILIIIIIAYLTNKDHISNLRKFIERSFHSALVAITTKFDMT